MTYLSPGVHIEEVESRPRPIEGVSTAIAAFVGLTVLVVLVVRRRRAS